MEIFSQQQQEEEEQQQQSKKMISSSSNKSKLSIITQPEAFYETAHEFADKVASTVIGQYAIDKIDRILSTIEKTAKWSLPQSEYIEPTNADKTSEIPVLDRPLPWIPFLATIMAIRAIRISLSFASILIGNEPISASSVVYFIQTRRRKLRYIKYNGLRNIRLKQQEAENKQNYGLINKINSLIGSLLCRSGNHNQIQDEYIEIKLKKCSKRRKSQKNQGRKKYKLSSKIKHHQYDPNAIAIVDENIPIELLKYLHDEGGDDSNDSDFTLDEYTSETTTTISEGDDEDADNNENEHQDTEMASKSENDELEKNKKLLEQLIQTKHEELENEIKNKLETQIEEKIALELNTKLDEKNDEIHNGNYDEQQKQQQHHLHQQQQQQQQQEINYENQQQEHQQLNINDDDDNNHNINNNNNNDDKIYFDNNSNNSSTPDNPSSVSINPLKISPEIAQNGNIDDEKYENLQTTTYNNDYIKEIKGYKKLTLNISSDTLSSSSEDIFYSPDIQSEYEKCFENHLSSIHDVIKQKDELNPVESTMPFIENEIKTNLQINLNPPSSSSPSSTATVTSTSNIQKPSSSTQQHSSRIKSKKLK